MNYKTEQILLHLLETQIQTLPADIVVGKKKEISPHFTTTFFLLSNYFASIICGVRIKVSPQPKRYKLIVC